jgi:hypothetical protein
MGRKYANKLAYRYRMQAAQKTQYSGTMTGGARKRLSKAITLMTQAYKPKTIFNSITQQYQYHHLSFITLTVSCHKNISTDFAYEWLLRPFLGWMRETKGVKCYVWKLEFQKRGQIHYHITFPDFIAWPEIRKTWNSLQRKAGLLDEYAKEHGHFDPNSTDIHAVEAKQNLANYIIKELGKSINAKRLHAKKIIESLIQAGEIPADQKKQFIDDYTGQELKAQGKIWDCSNNLSGAAYFTLPMESWHMEAFDLLRNKGQLYEVVDDWWSLIYLKSKDPPDILNSMEQIKLDDHLAAILN